MSSLLSTVQRFSCFSSSEDTDTSLFSCIACLPGLHPPSKCCFVAPRVLLMPYPTPRHKLKISGFLTSCEGRWMVWNVSEVVHDEFRGQTLEFVRKSFPNLPLLDLCLACTSLHSWLKSSPDNIALVHCQASRTRSALLLACFLRWTFGRFFSSLHAFRSVAQHLPEDLQLTPSNVRYLHYFDRMLCEGVPGFRRLKLRTIYLPKAIKAGTLYVLQSTAETIQREGIVTEQSVVFTVDTEVAHDVLIRYRVSEGEQRKTVFKLMFHTAFVKGTELVLSKSDLDLGDGASVFPSNAVVRLVFESNERFDDPELAQGWKLTLQRRACDRRNHQMDQIGRTLNRKKDEPDQVLSELFGD